MRQRAQSGRNFCLSLEPLRNDLPRFFGQLRLLNLIGEPVNIAIYQSIYIETNAAVTKRQSVFSKSNTSPLMSVRLIKQTLTSYVTKTY